MNKYIPKQSLSILLKKLDKKKISHTNITNRITTPEEYKRIPRGSILLYIIINDLSKEMKEYVYTIRQIMKNYQYIIFYGIRGYFCFDKNICDNFDQLIEFKNDPLCEICYDHAYTISHNTCHFKMCRTCWKIIINMSCTCITNCGTTWL